MKRACLAPTEKKDSSLRPLKFDFIWINAILGSPANFLRAFCATAIFFVFMTGCSGPEGPMGPTGPRGYSGEAFSYSVIYDVYHEDWTGDENGYYVNLVVPEITDAIFYDGAVLVYRLFDIAPKSFNMLPYTYVDGTLTTIMDYNVFVGNIELMFKEVWDGVNDTLAPQDDMAFKVVIIEGIPLLSLKSMVDITDMEAVMAFTTPQQLVR